jgi:hypothetical protein
LLSLLGNDLSHLLEEDIQITDTLLDIAYLVLSFYDEGLLEVNIILMGQPG